MKKTLFLTLVLLALGRSLPAQLTPAGSSTGSITTNAANCNTTNACIVLHMASSNVGYSVTVSGTWTGTLTVEQSGDNQGSWTSATTTTANTLFTSALTPGITDARVRGSAAMTGTAVVTITASGPATLQQITQTASSSSFPSSLNLNIIDGAAAKYGAKFDGGIILDASWTNGANPATITSAAQANWTSADVGKFMFGTGGCQPNNYGAVGVPIGTIVSVTDSKHIVVSTVPSSTASANGCFAWAHKDTAAIAAAWTDAVNASTGPKPCGAVIYPAGVTFIDSAEWITQSALCSSYSSGAEFGSGMYMTGSGKTATVFVITPDFNFASCTGGLSNSSCFDGLGSSVFTNFTIMGLNNARNGQSTGKKLFDLNAGVLSNVTLQGFDQQDANTTGLAIVAGYAYVDNVTVGGFGQICVASSANFVTWVGSAAGDCSSTSVNITAGSFTSVGGSFGGSSSSSVVVVSPSAIFNSSGDLYFGNTFPGAFVGIRVSGTARVNAATTIIGSGSTTSIGIWVNGGILYVQNTVLTGGSAGSDLLVDTNGQAFNLGGVSFSTGRISVAAGSIYVSGATISAAKDLTAQAANIGSTLLFTGPAILANNVYRATVYVTVNTAGTSGAITPNIIFNDGAVTQTVAACTTPAITSIGAFCQGTVTLHLAAGQNVNYSTTGITTPGALAYSLWLRLEPL